MSAPIPEKPTATVISVLDVPSTDPKRLGQTDVQIFYQIDATHVFQVKAPKESIHSPADIDKMVKADYQRVKEYINRQVAL